MSSLEIAEDGSRTVGIRGNETENWAEKPLLQQGDEQHPGTNVFGGASVPQGGERMGEQRLGIKN